MSYSPANTDATNVAQRGIDLANAAGSPGASPSLAWPPISDTSKAISDSLLDCLGYRAISDAQASAGNTSSLSFVDVSGLTTWTVSLPVTKTYLLSVDLSCFMNTALGGAYYQVLVDGSAVGSQPVYAAKYVFGATGTHQRLSWRLPVAFSAGSRVIKLQYKVDNASSVLQTDTGDFRLFTIQG